MASLILPTYHAGDLDFCKHLHRLVELLPPAGRLIWLQDCCRWASVGAASPVVVMNPPADIRGWLFASYTVMGQGRLTPNACILLAERALDRATGVKKSWHDDLVP